MKETKTMKVHEGSKTEKDLKDLKERMLVEQVRWYRYTKEAKRCMREAKRCTEEAKQCTEEAKRYIEEAKRYTEKAGEYTERAREYTEDEGLQD